MNPEVSALCFKVMSTKASLCQAEACLLPWETCGDVFPRQGVETDAPFSVLGNRKWMAVSGVSSRRKAG